MKYKLIGIGACLLGIVASVALLAVLAAAKGEGAQRYHQHLEAQEKEACSHGDEVFCTHLPLVMIDTGGVEIPGKKIVDERGATVGYVTAQDGSDRIEARMAVVDHEKTNNHPDDEPTVQSRITVHVRGRSSRTFDKPSYAVRLVAEDGSNNPLQIMGMDAHHEWALHGPFLDKTLLRNYMWYNVCGEAMDYAPNVRFCEVFLNGEYQGVYVMTETITAGVGGVGRLALSVDKKDNSYSGYLVQLDGSSDGSGGAVEQFCAYTLRSDSWLSIEYPGKSNITDEMKEAIRLDFSSFEKALYSYDYASGEYGYRKYIDVQSFVDYFIFNEFSLNFDAGIRSTYVYKGTDNKLHMCVWDFNNIFGNYFYPVNHHLDFLLTDRPWFSMLLKDEAFVECVIDRYRSLRKTILSDEYLTTYVCDVVDYLGPAIGRNYERWGYSFENEYDLKTPRHDNPRSYEEAIEDLIESMMEEGAWMDQNIEALRQYCAVSSVKMFNVNTR